MTVSVAGNTFWIFEGAARFGAPGAAAAAMSHGQRARERACAPARSRCPQRLKRTRAQSLRLWSGGWRRSRPAAARLSERRLRRRGFGEAKDGPHRLIAARARRDGGAEVLSRRGAHRSTYTLWSARAGPRPRQRPHPSLAAVQRRASITARPRTGIRWPALEGQDARIEPSWC